MSFVFSPRNFFFFLPEIMTICSSFVLGWFRWWLCWFQFIFHLLCSRIDAWELVVLYFRCASERGVVFSAHFETSSCTSLYTSRSILTALVYTSLWGAYSFDCIIYVFNLKTPAEIIFNLIETKYASVSSETLRAFVFHMWMEAYQRSWHDMRFHFLWINHPFSETDNTEHKMYRIMHAYLNYNQCIQLTHKKFVFSYCDWFLNEIFNTTFPTLLNVCNYFRIWYMSVKDGIKERSLHNVYCWIL